MRRLEQLMQNTICCSLGHCGKIKMLRTIWRQGVKQLLTICHACKKRWLEVTHKSSSGCKGGNWFDSWRGEEIRSVLIGAAFDENCGEWKRLQFLGRQRVTHFQSWANLGLHKWYSKRLLKKAVENEIWSLSELGLIIASRSLKRVSKGF